MSKIYILTEINNYLCTWNEPVQGVFRTLEEAVAFTFNLIKRECYTYSPLPEDSTDSDKEIYEEDCLEMPEEEIYNDLRNNKKRWEYETIYLITETCYTQTPPVQDLNDAEP